MKYHWRIFQLYALNWSLKAYQEDNQERNATAFLHIDLLPTLQFEHDRYSAQVDLLFSHRIMLITLFKAAWLCWFIPKFVSLSHAWILCAKLSKLFLDPVWHRPFHTHLTGSSIRQKWGEEWGTNYCVQADDSLPKFIFTRDIKELIHAVKQTQKEQRSKINLNHSEFDGQILDRGRWCTRQRRWEIRKGRVQNLAIPPHSDIFFFRFMTINHNSLQILYKGAAEGKPRPAGTLSYTILANDGKQVSNFSEFRLFIFIRSRSPPPPPYYSFWFPFAKLLEVPSGYPVKPLTIVKQRECKFQQFLADRIGLTWRHCSSFEDFTGRVRKKDAQLVSPSSLSYPLDMIGWIWEI